ncbi:MAG TPA: branched-chain amino acid ABC transporter permease/ATP-binding protein [Streptosporangiaceae bacterium]|jgi:sulfate-transporting ATPase
MTTVLQFAVLGLGIGAVYGLLAQGLVLIYRGSGVLNFAHGAMAMAGAFVFYELHVLRGWAFAPALIVAAVSLGIIGALVQLLILRRLRNASALTRLIATVGVLAVLEGIATIRYGGQDDLVPSSIPQHPITIGHIIVPEDRLWLLAIAIVITIALSAISRFTVWGMASSVTPHNPRAARALGWSPEVFATATWVVGSMLAAIAGALIVPITGLQVETLTLIVIAAMAAALGGGFSSFWLTLLAGVVIGIGQSEMAEYVTQPGVAESLPFLVIMVVLIVRGRGLPVRGELMARLPRLGTGAINKPALFGSAALLVVLLLVVFPGGWATAIGFELAVGVVLLSVVVVTGYTGQLSFAQFAMAGLGAFVAGRLVASAHWPFEVALVIGVVVAVPIGVIFGLPALRTRGVNLAVVTLGLGLAVDDIVFNNPSYTGGVAGTPVGAVHFLGVNLDPLAYPARYAVFCLVWFVIAALAVTNMRRGEIGRKLIAVRANERAAASLGISVTGAKLYGFAFGSAVAALGGILMGFQNYSIVYSSYDPISSINGISDTVIGGLGFATGPLIGSAFANGSILSLILNHFGSLDPWLGLIGGIAVLLVLLQHPEGMADTISRSRVTRWLVKRTATQRKADSSVALAAFGGLAPADRASVARTTGEPAPAGAGSAGLTVRGLSIRFGGVVAVDNVSFEVPLGQIVGLIGPNGAGKTTAIDAITGFVHASGTVRLGGVELTRLSAFRRSAAGLCRSFQSLELFEDLTVLDNLRTATGRRSRWLDLSALVRVRRVPLSDATLSAIRDFHLEPHLDRVPTELSYGQRRLVAIARAVATSPTVLLLDEPAAGLDDSETAELTELILALARRTGIGILLVEHDMNVIMRICDRVIVLDRGAKIADSTPAGIRHDPRVVAAYLGDRGAATDGGPDAPAPGAEVLKQ